ncbi:MAG TPA: class I SAM-dependent methyltransferase [Thermoplasmata archaeon]|nr:class I SAM-dependent methyltransferase [Thermoplasmata archaeon]
MPRPPTDNRLLELETGPNGPVPLRFVEDDGHFYVLATSARADWVAVSLRTGACSVTTRESGRLPCAVAPLVESPDRARIYGRFREKYGAAGWLSTFSPSTRILRLDPNAPILARSPADRARLEFDAAAAGYADRVAARPVERYQKSRTLACLRETFVRVDPLLEIGPGAGLETIPLLGDGHRITAVDLSPRMLEELRVRAERAGVADRLECRSGRLGDLVSTLRELPDGAFGGVFSTFGAFNLEEDLTAIRGGLARALPAGGRLVFTTLNRPGPGPMLWDFADGRFRDARRRLLARTTTENTTFPLDLFRRTPSEWDRALRPQFRRVRTEAVSVLAPPFEPARVWQRIGARGLRTAETVDGWLRRRSALAEFGEWSLLTYERRAPGAGALPRGPSSARV